MKSAELPGPEIGFIAITRVMLGAGLALLVAERLSAGQRRAIGWTLFVMGAVSTIPIVRDVLSKLH